MIFQEKKTEKGWVYKVQEVFGTIDMTSPEKLTGDVLDDITAYLLKRNLKEETVNGVILHEENKINYKFKKAPTWEDDDEDVCKNIPTSTDEMVKGSSWTARPMTRTLNWLQRFVGAFREAYKKAK